MTELNRIKQSMLKPVKNQVWVDIVETYKLKEQDEANSAIIMQQAIDEVSALGIWLIIPAGEYYLNASLIAKSGTKILAHKDAKFYRYHTACMVLNGVAPTATGNSDIWIEGGQWDCRGHEINDDGSAFAMGYAKNITIRNLKIFNVNYSHGMELCALDTVDVEFCEGYGFIDPSGTRTMAEFIQIERGTSTGFPYFGPGDGTICKDVRIKRAKVGPSDVAESWFCGAGSHDSIVNTGADGVYIEDCDFSLARKTGIQIKAMKNVVVERTKAYGEKGIEIGHDQSTYTNVTIRKCDIKGTVVSGISLDGVTGLYIEQSKIDGYTNAIFGQRSKHVDADHRCELYSQTSDAVTIVTNSSHINFNRCIVKKAGRHAFNIYDGAQHYRIRDCVLEDVTTNAFNLAGANTKHIQITGNTVTDTTLTNIINSSAGADNVVFKDNVYPASIAVPINSAAVNSDVQAANNRTF
jgi:hypothetical protein